MNLKYIPQLLFFFTPSVIAEPIITQRGFATADIIVTDNVRASIHLYIPIKKNVISAQRNIDNLEVKFSVHGGQKVAIALDKSNFKKLRQCVIANGMEHSLYYCLEGNKEKELFLDGLYYGIPTGKTLILRASSTRFVPIDTYSLIIDVVSYSH